MHIGYVVVVAAAVLRHARRPFVRALAALYPLLVLLTVVATSNHFFFDAATGAITAALAAALALVVMRKPKAGPVARFPERPLPVPDELAA